MTATAAELIALAERVEGLKGQDWDVAMSVCRVLDAGFQPNLLASLDAVVSLIEQVLPGHGWTSGKDLGGQFYAEVYDSNQTGDWQFSGAATSPAGALLAATLRAKASEVAG